MLTIEVDGVPLVICFGLSNARLHADRESWIKKSNLVFLSSLVILNAVWHATCGIRVTWEYSSSTFLRIHSMWLRWFETHVSGWLADLEIGITISFIHGYMLYVVYTLCGLIDKRIFFYWNCLMFILINILIWLCWITSLRHKKSNVSPFHMWLRVETKSL